MDNILTYKRYCCIKATMSVESEIKKYEYGEFDIYQLGEGEERLGDSSLIS